MARFRAPSTTSSYASIDSATSSQRRVDAVGRVSNIAKKTLRVEPVASSSCAGAVKQGKRKRSTSDEEKKALIQEAFRLERLRMNMKRRENSFIYVGNIPPNATESSLRLLFRKCGSISDITIRCTSGVSTRIDYAHWEPNINRYASIMFARPKSVRKALQLNGTIMNGQPIAVVLSVGHLPETKGVIEWRVNMIKERKGLSKRPKAVGHRGLMPSPTHPHNGTLADIKPQQLNCEPMEVQKTQSAPAAPKSLIRNFMFWNMTFPKSII